MCEKLQNLSIRLNQVRSRYLWSEGFGSSKKCPELSGSRSTTLHCLNYKQKLDENFSETRNSWMCCCYFGLYTVQLSFTFELLLPCRVAGLKSWVNLHNCTLTEPLSLLPVSFIQYVYVISSNEPSHFYQWVTLSSLMSHDIPTNELCRLHYRAITFHQWVTLSSPMSHAFSHYFPVP